MNTLAARGTIWTVPEAGRDALCLIISEARGLARGRPEFQVVPLVVVASETRHGELDFRLGPDETSLGVEVYAALWNSRPLLGEDLGEPRGRVVSSSALNELRDGYLRLADPSIPISEGRFGLAASREMDPERSAAVSKWQRLSGRVLQRLVEPPEVISEFRTFFYIEGESDWSRFYFDQLEGLAKNTREGDSLLGSAVVLASGVQTGIVSLPLWSETRHAVRLLVLTATNVVGPVSYHRDTVEVRAETSPFDTREMRAVSGLAEAT